MRLPRMTTRRWMFAVEVLALALAATIEVPRLWDLRRQYLGMAGRYADWEAVCNWQLNIYRERLPGGDLNLRRMEQVASYCAWMREKYEGAARSPWLPVEGDQPCLVDASGP